MPKPPSLNFIDDRHPILFTVHGWGEPFDIRIDPNIADQLAVYIDAHYGGNWQAWLDDVISEAWDRHIGKDQT